MFWILHFGEPKDFNGMAEPSILNSSLHRCCRTPSVSVWNHYEITIGEGGKGTLEPTFDVIFQKQKKTKTITWKKNPKHAGAADVKLCAT